MIDCKLLCIREYISRNYEYSLIMKEVHALDFIYRCIPDSHMDLKCLQADIGQIGIEWLSINEIKRSLMQTDHRLRTYTFSRTTHDLLQEFLIEGIKEIYLGWDFGH